MKPVSTLIVIADGENARFFRHAKPGAGLVADPSLDMSEKHQPSHDMGEARPGRTYQSHGAARSGMEPRSDPHEQAEVQFAHALAHHLDALMAADAADRLVIAADPKTLGVLRKALSPQTAGKLAATLGKDLVKTPVHDLPGHFADVLAL